VKRGVLLGWGHK